MNFNGINIPQKLVPHNYLQLGLAAQRGRQRQLKELLEKVAEEKRKTIEIRNCLCCSENCQSMVGGMRRSRSWCTSWPHWTATISHTMWASASGRRALRAVSKKFKLNKEILRLFLDNSELVARRHYNFGHGIGRSGDLLEAQPKAAGSTLLASLTNALLLDLMKMLGLQSCRGCFLVPLATGMTLTLCLQALRKRRPNAKYVLWSRIDQKSCFKAITAAGLQPIVIPVQVLAHECTLVTDCGQFEQRIRELGAANILCLYSTTSCFAPRNCDSVVELAKLAKSAAVPHLVNNAYGLQCEDIMGQLERAQRVGRIDYVVQSTDKNLLVPVGGAIVASCDEQLLQHLASSYAGRASSSQTLDVFMTLLSLGRSGYQALLRERRQNFQYLKQRLQQFAAEHGEIVPQSTFNQISLALTVSTLRRLGEEEHSVTQLGAMLHSRGVSGVRVVPVGQTKSIDGYEFKRGYL